MDIEAYSLTFCDICGREILCDDEIGDIEKSSYILNGKRIKSRTVWCFDCYEEKKETYENFIQSLNPKIENDGE